MVFKYHQQIALAVVLLATVLCFQAGRAAPPADSREAAVPLHEAACWRMLPVNDAKLAGFERQMASLEIADPDGRWLSVF